MLPVWLSDTVTSDLDRALHYTLLWGLEGVVLRTVGTQGDRVPHVNETKVKRRIAEHDVTVAAIDPGLFEQPVESKSAWLNDLAMLPEVCGFAQRVECKRILVGTLPGDLSLATDALQRAGAVAARYNIVLAVQNEREGRASGQAVAKLLDAVRHPNVRAAWSPANALEQGEQAVEGLAALSDHVEFVSARDGVRGPSGWESRDLGDGDVGWDVIFQSLHDRGYGGPVSLDLSGLAKGKAGLTSATALIRLLRQVRRQ